MLTLDRGKFLAFLAAMLFQAYNVKHARIQGTLVLPVLSSIIPVVDIYNRRFRKKEAILEVTAMSTNNSPQTSAPYVCGLTLNMG